MSCLRADPAVTDRAVWHWVYNADGTLNAETYGGAGRRDTRAAETPASCTIQLYNKSMKALNVSEFREQCLSLLDHLPADGVLITKRGEPIARVLPVKQNNADLIGRLAGVFRDPRRHHVHRREMGC